MALISWQLLLRDLQERLATAFSLMIEALEHTVVEYPSFSLVHLVELFRPRGLQAACVVLFDIHCNCDVPVFTSNRFSRFLLKTCFRVNVRTLAGHLPYRKMVAKVHFMAQSGFRSENNSLLLHFQVSICFQLFLVTAFLRLF